VTKADAIDIRVNHLNATKNAVEIERVNKFDDEKKLVKKDLRRRTKKKSQLSGIT